MKYRTRPCVLVILMYLVFAMPIWAAASGPQLRLKSLDGGVPVGEPLEVPVLIGDPVRLGGRLAFDPARATTTG